MAELNIIHHMNEMKKILLHSKNIGFFCGAGTSCAFGLPSIKVLTKEVYDKLDPENQNIYKSTSELVSKINNGKEATIEDILNTLRQIREITKERSDLNYNGITGEQALSLDNLICREIYNNISAKEEIADIKELRKFFAWYDSATNGFIKEIFTTNYDMLFEKAMEANYLPYFDGFVGAYEPFFNPESIDEFPRIDDSTGKWIRLWKIHGSLNWTLKESFGTDIKRIVRTGKVDNPINELMIYPSKEKYMLSRKEPFIAYFDRLKSYMTKGELLFIFSGYSFSDQHINDIVFNALRQNPRLYVVVTCFSDDQVEEMKETAVTHLNLCVMGPKKVIANGKEYDWKYDDNEDDTQGYEFYWDAMKEQMVLGDFTRLIEFLIDNSGRRSIIEEIANGK